MYRNWLLRDLVSFPARGVWRVSTPLVWMHRKVTENSWDVPFHCCSLTVWSCFCIPVQVNACWTNLRSSSLSRTACLAPATVCTVNVSWPSAKALNPAPTCSPAQSCGAPGTLEDSRSVKPATFPGQMAQTVSMAKSATEVPVLINTAQCTSRWDGREITCCSVFLYMNILLMTSELGCLFFSWLRWMATGGSGVHLETVQEVVVEVFSWPEESVIILSLRMVGNTAVAFASNTAHVILTLVLK